MNYPNQTDGDTAQKKAIDKLKATDKNRIYNESIKEKMANIREYVIYRKALNKWGGGLQSVMVIEEMAELTQEIIKVLRGRIRTDRLAEEIADVEIMLGQLKAMHNIHTKVRYWKRAKLKKLDKTLKDDKRGA